MTKVDSEEVPSSIEGLQASYEKILQNQRVDLKDVERILPVTPMQKECLWTRSNT